MVFRYWGGVMERSDYVTAVQTIKAAILESQYEAARSVNASQLQLYYAIGSYISANTRSGAWGTGALKTISERLQRELPGLRGFSATNLRNMRLFSEAWESLFICDKANSTVTTDELRTGRDGLHSKSTHPNFDEEFADSFFSIGFTHHMAILSSTKTLQERLYYIHRCAKEHLNVEGLKRLIRSDAFHHQGALPNNFLQTVPESQRALKAINAFKDEYLLDYINVEELGARDRQDVDERVLEQSIIHNIKNFILTFGKGFAFVGNQYHLEAFGVDQYIDLLFFNRDLNCLVAVELKSGPFKTTYLGQLTGYLSVLDGFEKREHENPSIGLVLCKDMDEAFVDYVIRDFNKPLSVATYKTSEDMPEKLRQALPPTGQLKALLENRP